MPEVGGVCVEDVIAEGIVKLVKWRLLLVRVKCVFFWFVRVSLVVNEE